MTVLFHTQPHLVYTYEKIPLKLEHQPETVSIVADQRIVDATI